MVTRIADGLSIPFVSFSRKATRSLSISATLASGNSPEWLNSARRAPPSGNPTKRAPTPHHTDTVPATDIEAGPTATSTQVQASELNANRIFVDAEVCILALTSLICELMLGSGFSGELLPKPVALLSKQSSIHLSNNTRSRPVKDTLSLLSFTSRFVKSLDQNLSLSPNAASPLTVVPTSVLSSEVKKR